MAAGIPLAKAMEFLTWANVKSREEFPAFCGRGHQAAQQRVWIQEGCRTLRQSAPGSVWNSRKHNIAYVPGKGFSEAENPLKENVVTV